MSLSDEYKKIESVLMHLPRAINEEIRRIVRTRSGLLEIRLRRYGLSELIFGTGRVGLGSRLSGDDMDRILASLTEGSLYAHRGSIAEGFITLRGGIRVAVVGVARYEGSALVGVSDVSSLNLRMQREPFRIKEVEEAFQLAKRGLLSSLPEELERTARLRLEHKDLSLSQLAPLCVPPITKPGLSHRLNKIVQIADRMLIEEK